MHMNQGRDFRRGGAVQEWTPLPAQSFLAERFQESDKSFWRSGIRYAISPSVSSDLRRAGNLNNSIPAGWTLVINLGFEPWRLSKLSGMERPRRPVQVVSYRSTAKASAPS